MRVCVSVNASCIFLRACMCVRERLPSLRWKEQMGGGSGLLCLRTTVALRIRVPPTFHPGPQLPTTAHGARPAPAHHGPAPRAICLLGQTTPLLSPPSQRCVLASLLLRHATRIPKPRKQAQQFHGCYMLLFGALERQKELEEMIQSGGGRAKHISTCTSGGAAIY